jgi:hypothetical protein
MLMQSGINVRPDVYDAIRNYNHGIGYASQIISGARSPYDVGCVSVGFNLSGFSAGYNLSGFDTGL